MMEMFNISAADWCVAVETVRLRQGERRFWRAVIHTQLHRQPALLHSLGGLDFIPAPAADFAPFGSYERKCLLICADCCLFLQVSCVSHVASELTGQQFWCLVQSCLCMKTEPSGFLMLSPPNYNLFVCLLPHLTQGLY